MWLSGLNKSKESLKLSNTAYKRFNVSRTTAYAALRSMEKMGLIKIERTVGKKNRITIVETL
jgi:DNA-binding GntR family transcriptional regulator